MGNRVQSHRTVPASGGTLLDRFNSTSLAPGEFQNACITKTRLKAQDEPPSPFYRGADVPMSAIRRFVREVAERFQPEKIILFGSYAYGTLHADSDVDILVIMPTRNEIDHLYRPMHLCVCTKAAVWTFLSQFAVDSRYPGFGVATKRQAEAAVRWAARARHLPDPARPSTSTPQIMAYP